MPKKKICWVTADYFADCDIPLVPLIAKEYNIHWIILFSARGNRYKDEDYAEVVKGVDGLTVEFVHNKVNGLRGFNPYILWQMHCLRKSIDKAKPDIIYYNVSRDTPFQLPFLWGLPKDKTIFTAHQGRIRRDMHPYHVVKFVRAQSYKGVKYVNMFSSSEASKLHETNTDINICIIPLALKYFGEPHNQRPKKDVVRFLSFGLMVYAKHVDLLIDAANILYEKGYRNFKVVIKGAGYDWERVKEHVKYPEIIESDIRRIDNDEIPDLFNGSHFLVQPYRYVSQSGPMKIAFRYNLPDIVSNLPGLTCELKEGVNGYSFKSEDVNDLARVMENCINQSSDDYDSLCNSMKRYTAENYSREVIVKKYCEMFDQVVKNKAQVNNMNIKAKLGGVFVWLKQSYAAVFLRILFSKLLETCIQTRYMASYGMLKDANKLKTHIAIKAHALEKGMSIGSVRYGFGKQKAFSILNDLPRYIKYGGDKIFVEECCAIIERYIEFNEAGKADMTDVIKAYEDFIGKFNAELLPYGGILEFNHKDLIEKEHAPFDEFSQYRYAIRDFDSTPIAKENIEKALKLTERTPTACNRQSHKIHIFLDKEKKDKICSLQGGCKGIYEDMQGAILVCEDLTGYSSAETNLPYVDGSLYAMNLMYALNYYDIATIPLTMGHKAHKNIHILKEMGIGLNEVPVLLIGIGSYKGKWKVAQSHRKSWKEYVTFDK